MQDRFRFRCFNNFQNKIFEVKNISYIDGIVKRIEVQDEERILIFDEWQNNIDNTFLIQCTGIKDKNGKLIYEGDIVEILGDEIPYVIEYDEDRARFVIDSEIDRVCCDFDNYYGYELEIIGNIYENDELLQGE